MKPEDIERSTGLNIIREAWMVFDRTLPIVWHERIGVSVVLTPPDDHLRVLCVGHPLNYVLLTLSELIPLRTGTPVVLHDSRRGQILNLSHMSSYFMFVEDGADESVMIPADQISCAFLIEEVPAEG